MKLREDFVVRLGKEEVIARSDALLSAYGYKREAGTGALLYVRGTPNAIFYHINPRRYRSEIELWPVLKANGTEVSVSYKLTRMGSPILPATKDLYLGEFSDLIRYLLDDQEPNLDRAAQSAQVGLIQIIILLFCITIIALTLFLVLLFREPAAMVSVFVAMILIIIGAMAVPLKAAAPPLTKPT